MFHISFLFFNFSNLQDYVFSFTKNFWNTKNFSRINDKNAFAKKEDEALRCPLLDNTNNYVMDIQSRIDLKHTVPQNMIRTNHQDSFSWETDAPCRGVVTSTICGISLGQKDSIQLKLSELMSTKFLQIRKNGRSVYAYEGHTEDCFSMGKMKCTVCVFFDYNDHESPVISMSNYYFNVHNCFGKKLSQ